LGNLETEGLEFCLRLVGDELVDPQGFELLEQVSEPVGVGSGLDGRVNDAPEIIGRVVLQLDDLGVVGAIETVGQGDVVERQTSQLNEGCVAPIVLGAGDFPEQVRIHDIDPRHTDDLEVQLVAGGGPGA